MVAGGLGLAVLGFAGGFAAHQPKDKIVNVPGATVTVTVPGPSVTVQVPASGSGLTAIPDPTGAGAGVIKYFSLQFTGPVSDYFDLLHPAQQAQIEKKFYLSCVKGPPAGSKAPKLAVIDLADTALDIPGIPEKTAKSVTFVVDDAIIRRLYAVKSGGKWRWVMGANELNLYKAKRCK